MKDETLGNKPNRAPAPYPNMFSKIAPLFGYRVCGKWNIPFQV